MDKTLPVATEEIPHRRVSGARRRLPVAAPLHTRLLVVLGAALWYLLYIQLMPAASWLTHGVLRLRSDSHLAKSVEFFLFEAPKVLLLLVAVVFAVGIVRSYFTPERARALLAGRRESAGNALAACLGVVTPFCSCSAVPLFLGFVQSGVPLGVTFSFLIAAPMVNEVAVVLLFGLFGAKIAAIYVGTGLAIAIAAGWVIGRLGMERHLEPWVLELRGTAAGPLDSARLDWNARVQAGVTAVREVVGRVWVFVVAGIGVGAGIHGYVPADSLAGLMGKDAWWAVPLAVLLGVPMYSNAAGVVPVVQALLGKGAALGTALAFMMAVIALSTPEIVILRKVLRPRLIVVFVGVVATGIVLVGYLFNGLF